MGGIDLLRAVANALSIPPGDYGRKAKTQRNYQTHPTHHWLSGGIPVAKAAYWAVSDAEARERGSKLD